MEDGMNSYYIYKLFQIQIDRTLLYLAFSLQKEVSCSLVRKKHAIIEKGRVSH